MKSERNVTPAMLCSLAIFCGMYATAGIKEIKADGFLTRRYGHFLGAKCDEEWDDIMHNAVDKYFKLYCKLASQFEGIDILAYPFDVDSYMHIALERNIASKNRVASEFFEAGKRITLK